MSAEDPKETPIASDAAAGDAPEGAASKADALPAKPAHAAAPAQKNAAHDDRPAAAEETPSRKRGRATARKKVRRAPNPERRRRVLIALAVVALTIAMLYRPARDYYLAWRAGYTLGVRNEALAEENEELREDLDRLMTREGVEDEARKRGYVLPGETSVKVEGLDDTYESSGKASDLTGEEDLPWYIHVGDAIFFYKAER